MKKTYIPQVLLAMMALLFSVNIKAQVSYCPQQATFTGDDEIFNVTLGTLNNTSACNNVGGPGSIASMYQNYTALTPPNLITGLVHTISVTGGQCSGFAYSGNIYVWIDYNQNGSFLDLGEQVFTAAGVFNVAGSVYTNTFTVPLAVTFGNTRMRVTLVEGSVGGPCTNFAWGEVEDYTVNLISNTPCSSVPATNTILPTSFTTCPSYVNPPMSLATNYTLGGITYQWYSSTISPVGLFTPINGATLSTAPVPTLGVTTWFQAVVNCTNIANGTYSVNSNQYFVASSTTSTVPYYEDFEGLQIANRLPNCSWYAGNLGTSVTTYMGPASNNRVPNSGTKFAAFGLPSNNNYVYSNGISMVPGITYSASIQYATEYLGSSNWTSLEILVGPNQSTTGLVQVASISPAVSGSYKELSGLFTVPSGGDYYIAIKATAASGTALYLSWDDLRVTIPCEGTAGAPNAPVVTLAVPSQSICLGQSINLSASGADTYTWNTGATSSGITDKPANAGFAYYSVTGQNALTGCMNTVTQTVTVSQSPVVLTSAYPATVCPGQPVTLNAIGNGVSYLWSNGLNGAVVSVTTNAAANYTVIATGANGCTAESPLSVNVHAAASVVATGGSPDACAGDQITLNASGASSYQWISNTSANVLQGSAVNVVLNGPTVFTVTATNVNGCTARTTVSQDAKICVGVKEFANAISGLMVYPNPVSDAFTVELNSETAKTIEVMDLTGRIILSTTSADEKINVNVRDLANGVYYVRVKTNEAVDVIKVVKQ